MSRICKSFKQSLETSPYQRTSHSPVWTHLHHCAKVTECDWGQFPRPHSICRVDNRKIRQNIDANVRCEEDEWSFRSIQGFVKTGRSSVRVHLQPIVSITIILQINSRKYMKIAGCDAPAHHHFAESTYTYTNEDQRVSSWVTNKQQWFLFLYRKKVRRFKFLRRSWLIKPDNNILIIDSWWCNFNRKQSKEAQGHNEAYMGSWTSLRP